MDVLHHATIILDRCVWNGFVKPDKFLLVGMAALFVASKFFSMNDHISAEQLCELAQDQFTKEQVGLCAHSIHFVIFLVIHYGAGDNYIFEFRYYLSNSLCLFHHIHESS